MILIIDCTDPKVPLLKDEFVQPIITIVRQAGYELNTLTLASKNPTQEFQGVILTGTALMDHQYLNIGLPEWLKEWKGPVLGICAGMQMIAIASGGGVIPSEEIGMTDITVTKADPLFADTSTLSVWELHQSGVWISEKCTVLAQSPSGIQAFKLQEKPWYGLIFHPEVRNEWIFTNFLKLCNSKENEHCETKS